MTELQTPPCIQQIVISGWKSIRNVSVELKDINILLGVNGSGKSSFLSAFSLMRAAANGELAAYIAKNGGANANFHYGTKTTENVTFSLKLKNEAYNCTISPDTKDTAYIHTSALKRSSYKKMAVETGIEPPSPYLQNPDALSETDTYNKEVANLLAPFITYHFHDTGATSPLKRINNRFQTRYLYPDGANLAAYLCRMQTQHPQSYAQILHAVRMVFPDIKKFIFREEGDAIQLLWNDIYSENYDFPISSLSDGTLRFIALATLLLQPNPPAVIIIDEPELGLHPDAVRILADLLRVAASKSQIICATQSVQLVNCFHPENILVVEKIEGETTIQRPDPASLTSWLEDYALGDIWEMNVLSSVTEKPLRRAERSR